MNEILNNFKEKNYRNTNKGNGIEIYNNNLQDYYLNQNFKDVF